MLIGGGGGEREREREEDEKGNRLVGAEKSVALPGRSAREE